MATVLDYLNGDPLALILAKANALNTGDAYEVDVSEITFSDPVAVVASTHDTEVTLTPNADSPYINTRVLKYTRFDLATLIDIGPSTIVLPDAAELLDIVTELNTRFGFSLQFSDIDEAAIGLLNPFTDGDEITITALATSYLFKGTVTLNVVHAAILVSENDLGS